MTRRMELREWWTLEEAAEHLSAALNCSVTQKDVLRLSAEGKVRLSVYFVNGASARCGIVRPLSDFGPAIPPFTEVLGSMPTVGGFPRLIRVRAEEVLELQQDVQMIDGVWDLAMIGNEQLDIERMFQRLTHGPAVSHPYVDGTFVQQGTRCCQLLAPHPEETHVVLGGTLVIPKMFAPTEGLPDDGVLVVRTETLKQLIAGLVGDARSTAPPDVLAALSPAVGSRAEVETKMVGGPGLAAFLRAEMQKRDGMSVNRLHVLSGLDRKTIEKMLAGKRVRENLLERLARGLSCKDSVVSASEIPVQ